MRPHRDIPRPDLGKKLPRHPGLRKPVPASHFALFLIVLYTLDKVSLLSFL